MTIQFTAYSRPAVGAVVDRFGKKYRVVSVGTRTLRGHITYTVTAEPVEK